jgi:hypothetical protein
MTTDKWRNGEKRSLVIIEIITYTVSHGFPHIMPQFTLQREEAAE